MLRCGSGLSASCSKLATDSSEKVATRLGLYPINGRTYSERMTVGLGVIACGYDNHPTKKAVSMPKFSKKSQELENVWSKTKIKKEVRNSDKEKRTKQDPSNDPYQDILAFPEKSRPFFRGERP